MQKCGFRIVFRPSLTAPQRCAVRPGAPTGATKARADPGRLCRGGRAGARREVRPGSAQNNQVRALPAEQARQLWAVSGSARLDALMRERIAACMGCTFQDIPWGWQSSDHCSCCSSPPCHHHPPRPPQAGAHNAPGQAGYDQTNDTITALISTSESQPTERCCQASPGGLQRGMPFAASRGRPRSKSLNRLTLASPPTCEKHEM